MPIKIFNTLTRQKEDFKPVSDIVWFYSCWPTVYGVPTIGNYRAFWTADLVRNTLKLAGYKTKSVMNITDVWHLVWDWDHGEDKLEKWAKRDGTTARDVAKKYEEEFKAWLKEMNIDFFDVMPRATEHIQEQIDLVQTLEKKWYTYKIDNDWIYMDTAKIEDYWKLLWPNYKQHLEWLQSGTRVEMWWKKNPTDFALRKFSPAGEQRQMERDSPWGVGFPWWHAECSAMSSKYLWEQFDIHHGGADHINIHHPNEIAQSECCFEKKPWVKYWVHNQFLQVDWWKMGKSLWNMYSLEDIKAKWYNILDLRYFYFMAHYRSFQNFTWEHLESAKNARKNLKKKIQNLNIDVELTAQELSWNEFFVWALNIIWDDFNTPELLAFINSNLTQENIWVIKYLDENLLKVWLFQVEEKSEIPAEIIELANQRLQAKADKNYQLADELREEITNKWFTIKDVKDWFQIE